MCYLDLIRGGLGSPVGRELGGEGLCVVIIRYKKGGIGMIPPFFIFVQSLFTESAGFRISTLRFNALPSALSLEDLGLSKPYPTG